LQRNSLETLLSALQQLQERQGGAPRQKLKRALLSIRDFIAKWSPLLGLAAAIGFGTVAVLAFIEQRVANKIADSALAEARVANDLARRALDFAAEAARYTYYTYLGLIAQVLMDQIQMCEDHPVRDAIIRSCGADW
jgi:hypothetical protein